MTEHASPESIFELALQCTDANERTIFMEEACGENEDLRREVESLLAAHQAAGSFLKPQVNSKPNASSEGEGARIGRYVLREMIGEGSFGRVWLAEQVAPMRRLVALKILRLGLESSDLQGHFDAELQALAMMDHQCIATVYDGGTTESGRPYFVMEYVRGVPITDFCDLRRFSLRQRIQLLCKVCRAVQHAHDNGIIHRDLKPSNILVKLQDNEAVPKVIDFGVAKALGQNLSEHDFFARYIQWAGTPTYMSPEQAGIHGKPHVDVRSDVYSLGIILYELLTDRTPFDSHKLREAGPETILRAIREQDAPRLSARFTSLPPGDRFAVALYRGEKPRTLRRGLEGELDRILGKALQRDRRMRYDSASALAKDLDHHCRGGLTSAHQPNLRTTGSWAHRKPAAVVAAVVTGLLIVVLGWSLSIRMGKNKRIEQYNALVAQADVEGVTEIPVDENQLCILLEAVRGLRNTKRETIYQTLYLSKATDGTDIDQVIAGNATQQVMSSDIRKKLFKVLELRANPEVIPKLLEFATSSSNTGEVAAALEACERMATDDHFGEFLKLLEAAGNGSIRHSAETTISEIIGRSNDRQELAGQLLSAHRRQLNETTRHSLIRLLGHTGTDTAREKLMKSLGSGDMLEKQAAILAIGNWPDDSMFKVLIEFIWTTDDPQFRQRAFKTAYHHLRYKKSRRSTGEAGVLWKLLATVAKTEGEKKGVINSMPQIEGDWRIPLLRTFLNDESDRVRDDAERAIDYLGGSGRGRNQPSR